MDEERNGSRMRRQRRDVSPDSYARADMEIREAEQTIFLRYLITGVVLLLYT